MSDVARLTIGAVHYPSLSASVPGFTDHTLDAANDACEYVVQAPDATPITRLGFRYGARTGTPPTYKISLQGVDASGNPDGTIKGGGSPASATFTPPATTAWDATFQWITLANSYTPARGEWLAVVIAYDSGTVDGSNCSSFTLVVTNSFGRMGTPYSIQNAATVRTRQTTPPVFGVGRAESAFGWPIQTWYMTLVSSNTDPDELALAFSLPSGVCASYQVLGVRIAGQPGAAAKTIRVTLYSGTDVLQQVDVDSDFNSNVAGKGIFRAFFDEAILSNLTPGTTYRIGFAPQQTSTSFGLYGMTSAAAADLSAWPDGTAWYLSTRTDSGAWSDDTATRPLAEIILADITPASGGGGGFPILGGSVVR